MKIVPATEITWLFIASVAGLLALQGCGDDGTGSNNSPNGGKKRMAAFELSTTGVQVV